MFNKILVVCFGNICRSPSGEHLLQRLLPDKQIASAGIGALVGRSADKSAEMVAQNHGISLAGHQARQLTADLCRSYDLILVMEKSYIGAVAHLAPEVRGKTMLFGYWLEEMDIPDPYHQNNDAFEFTYKLIAKAALEWAKKLTDKQPGTVKNVESL